MIMKLKERAEVTPKDHCHGMQAYPCTELPGAGQEFLQLAISAWTFGCKNGKTLRVYAGNRGCTEAQEQGSRADVIHSIS